ncbi:hypothetical protein M1146_05310 [Patescibacteria group bacterium]|nr:hypothetical protein [Patescibacteria group bacterium]
MIPNDPIESTDDNEESGDVSFTYIPWNLPDEVLEEEPVKETPKLYSNNLYTNNNNSVSSSSINYSANILNQRTDNDDAFIKSLPLHLQYLDPLALGILCQDKSIVQLILKPGEAVDDRYMNILQNSSTLEEFRASCNALANSDMYSPNPSWSVPPAQPASYGNQYSLTSTWDNSIFTAPIGNMSNPMPGMPSYSYQQPISVGINPHVNPISSVPSIHTSKLASRKASTPCRFFNTPKGCLSGDKCPFGHFGNISVPTYAPGGFRAPGSRRPAPGDANILTGEHPSKRFRK